MAKKIVKKTVKKAAKKTAKKTTAAVGKKPAKKAVSKAAALKALKPAKKAVKKKRTSSLATGGKKRPAKKVAVKKKTGLLKDKETKQANLIANTEKKKKSARAISGKTKTKRVVKTVTDEQTTALVDAIIDGMQERKAKNITIINLTGIENSVSDFFVICDADSKTHVEAIADSVDEVVLKTTNEQPFHAEGFENAEWILMDYINVVVHVFQKEVRDYYNLEALWADAEITLA